MFDFGAIKRYHDRVDGRLKARGIRLDGIFRFDFDETKHPRDENGRFASSGAAMNSKTEVNGPKETKGFIKDYFAKNPEVKKDVKKFKGILDKVKNFTADGDGTFSATTGEKLDLDDGYCVTFHQNYTLDDKFGAYDDESYAQMCAIAKHALGSDDVYIGYYGNPEVSFKAKDYKSAMDFAMKHNQKSIFNNKTKKTRMNWNYNPKTNPIEGDEDSEKK